jgi:nuclear pore complex protein Nup188
MGEFWERIVAIACHEVGPVPEYTPSEIIVVDGIRRSSLHDSIQAHSYRSLVKSYALHILTRDIGLHLHLHRSEVPLKKPESYLKLEPYLRSQDQLTDLLAEAAPSSYAPHFHDEVVALLQEHFQGLTLSQLEQQDPISDREYGENFAFTISLLRLRLQAYAIPPDIMDDPSENAEKLMMTINLNLSLAHSETSLIEAWNALLRQVIPYMRMDTALRPHILAIAASISYDIASEKRSGEMMSNIHGARLSLVLVLLEVAWFSSKDTKAELESFMELTRNLRGIVLNEGQSPARSLLSSLSNPFHRTLLQIIFFFAKQARSLINRPKTLNAEQRLTISSTVEAILTFVIDALRLVFVAARSRSDIDLDRDMELLVAVFEQCTRPDLVTTSNFWLARCQEMDVIHASLDLYVHLDLAGRLICLFCIHESNHSTHSCPTLPHGAG